MQVDLSADYLCWDATESVVLNSVNRTGARQVPVSVAKGRNIRVREKSPSNGVYAGYERNWHLPARLLPADVACKPGDQVLDAAGILWTALTAEFDRLKCRWQLGTVALVLALDLSDSVVIERAAITYDASGAAVKTFPPGGGRVLYTLQARVQLITEEIAEERGERYSQGRYDVIVGDQVPLLDAAEDRVRWQDPDSGKTVYLDVLRVRNPERIDELPVIETERRR